jgi:hypothetical protein
MAAVEQALLSEEAALAPRTSGTETVVTRRPSYGPAPWQRWAAIGAAGAAFLLLAFFLLTHKSSPPRPAVTATAPADLAVHVTAPPPDLHALVAVAGNGNGMVPEVPKNPAISPPPEETPEPTGDSNKPDGNKVEVGKEPVGRSPKGIHPSSLSVRFGIEPAAVSALVVCKSRRLTCHGGCQVLVPEGASCTVSAPGYLNRELRYKDLRAERGKLGIVHVRLSPVKLKFH